MRKKEKIKLLLYIIQFSFKLKEPLNWQLSTWVPGLITWMDRNIREKLKSHRKSEKGTRAEAIILLVIPLVHEWNIVVLPEFNELKLVFHEAPAEWNTSFNELNEGNKAIFHEWTKGITSEHHSFLLFPNFKTKNSILHQNWSKLVKIWHKQW